MLRPGAPIKSRLERHEIGGTRTLLTAHGSARGRDPEKATQNFSQAWEECRVSAVMPTLNNLVAKLTSRKSGSHVASGACLRLQTSFMDSAQILTGSSSATARPRARRKPTMPTTFEKLNLKSQTRILVLNAPDSFEK